MVRQTNPNIASPRPHGTMSRSVTLFVTLFVTLSCLTYVDVGVAPEKRRMTVS